MKKIYLIAVAAFMLTACDQNIDDPATKTVEVKVTAEIGDNIVSRASDNSWSEGDRIGITSVVGENARPQVNMEYTLNSAAVAEDGLSTFTGNGLFYYKGMKLTAYYPFTGAEGVAPGDNGIITVSTDAKYQKGDEQQKIDFLWDDEQDISLNKSTVNFVFTHRMTKLSFVFKSSDPTRIKVEDMIGYQIEGLAMDGTFNTNTGECSPLSDATAKDLKIDFEQGDAKDGEWLAPVILLPQMPIGVTGYPEKKAVLRLFLDEVGDKALIQPYSCVLDFGAEGLKAGHHYKFVITITKAGLKTDKMSIADWDDQEPFPIDATIDGDPVSEQ